MGRECEDCRGATPAKPPFERRWRGAPEDRMPRRGITTAVPHRRKNEFSRPAGFSAFARSYAPRRILSSAPSGHLPSKEGLQMCRSATFFECAFGVPSSGASRHLPPTRKAKQEAALKNPVASHRETIIRPYGAPSFRRRLTRGGSAAFFNIAARRYRFRLIANS